MVVFAAVGEGQGGGDPAVGDHGGGEQAGEVMEPCTFFHENIRVEFKKGIGMVFNKCAEAQALLVKMEETGEPFKLMSKDGKSFIAGAKNFLESEVVFNKLFDTTSAREAHPMAENAKTPGGLGSGAMSVCQASQCLVRFVTPWTCSSRPRRQNDRSATAKGA
jgi:hypothetical protein